MYTFSLDRQLLLLLCFRRHTYEFLTNEQTHNAHRHRKKNALLGQDGFADWTWCSRIEYIRGMVLACTTTTHRTYNNESSTTTTQMLSLSRQPHTHTLHILSLCIFTRRISHIRAQFQHMFSYRRHGYMLLQPPLSLPTPVCSNYTASWNVHATPRG